MDKETWEKGCDIQWQIKSLTQREGTDLDIAIEGAIRAVSNDLHMHLFGHNNHPATDSTYLDDERKAKIKEILLDWVKEIDTRKSDLEKQFEQL